MSDRRDAVLYGRVNVKQLAAIARYYDMIGQRVRSKSDMMDLIVNHLHEVLQQYGNPNLVAIDSEAEAIQILADYGMVWEKGKRGARNIISTMQQEAMEKDEFILPGQEVKRHTISSLEEEARRIAAEFEEDNE